MDEISVLVCDDSALMRNVITKALTGIPGIKVVDKAMNGQILINKIPLADPDVIVLDIEMPVMTGIEFLRYRKDHKIPVPVIMLSSIAEKGAAVTMEALELGASDFITKPNGSISTDINSVVDRLIEMIACYGGAFARSRKKQVYREDFYAKWVVEKALERKLSKTAEKTGDAAPHIPMHHEQAPIVLFDFMPKYKEPAVITPLRDGGRINIIAIGISTGGPNALREIFKNIDPHLKQPILVVQHMPAGFTKEFANSLNKICALEVKEAEDGDKITGGHVYIAPGNYHIYVEKQLSGNLIRLSQEPQRNGHRPSADVMFESIAKIYANNALGVIMTGMGKDGAVELAEMRKEGAWTLGQDEETSIVYGMPKVAYELGAVQKQVRLEDMADEISRLAREHAN